MKYGRGSQCDWAQVLEEKGSHDALLVDSSRSQDLGVSARCTVGSY